jgi:L-fuculose-phosphate aldolase
MNEKSIRDEICRIGKKLYLQNMTPANAGNISCKISEKEILITPTMVSKGDLKPKELLKIDTDGNVISGAGSPTSEVTSIHLTILKEKPGINAVIHAHPVYTSVFIVTGVPPPRGVLVETEAYFKEIVLLPYTKPGSKLLMKSLMKHLRNADAFLLSNHGAITIGTSLKEAYFRMETLEHSSKIIILSKLLGKIQYIPKEEMKGFE